MDWNEESPSPVTGATLKQMDELIQEIVRARLKYEELKDLTSAAHAEKQQLEKKMIDYLKAAGRSGYEHPTLGKALYYTKEVYETPKTPEEKQSLFAYIETKYGGETLLTMTSINHQTLNSWANKEVETGEVMQIPGLGQPTIVEVFNFRKGK